jgi:acetylglutamate kinase
MQPIIVKISGHELSDEAYLREFATTIVNLKRPVAVVHGGGKDITTYQERLDVPTQFVNGLRVTDAESLAIAEMVLCGLVNKRLVRYLLAAGADALGISAMDRGMVRARKMQADQDMMFTGEITSVQGAPLLELLDRGITPVIAPICLGEDSNFNVNADHVAGALALAIGAEKAVFITNVEGVWDAGRRRLPQLTTSETEALIADGTINGGMIPKVTTALEAAKKGISAVITNLQGLGTHGGTVIRG